MVKKKQHRSHGLIKNKKKNNNLNADEKKERKTVPVVPVRKPTARVIHVCR